MNRMEFFKVFPLCYDDETFRWSLTSPVLNFKHENVWISNKSVKWYFNYLNNCEAEILRCRDV